MDHGLDLGVPHLELQLQERPERQQNQDEDCYHTEGDDNFKVGERQHTRHIAVASWSTPELQVLKKGRRPAAPQYAAHRAMPSMATMAQPWLSCSNCRQLAHCYSSQ
jgi:hypothetical protein